VGISGAGRKLGKVACAGLTNGRPSIVVSQPDNSPVVTNNTADPSRSQPRDMADR
jgi:hypothetical protein